MIGVMIVVTKQITTQTENNVRSKIPLEYAREVMASPTVPLPFSSDAIVILSIFWNPQTRVPI